MAYPSKPWSDGQIATGIVPGETFVYDATQSVWTHVTKATLDSDYQVDQTARDAEVSAIQGRLDSDSTALQTLRTDLAAEISATDTDVSNLNSRIDADSDRLVSLTARVDTLDLLSDSEAGRVQDNIDKINVAFSMLDSDGIALQQIRTDLEAEISTTNTEISAIQARLDSDETVIQSLQTQIDNLDSSNTVLEADHDSDISSLAIPIISATQPAGKAGQLWVNLNDGRLYYWDTSQETFTEIVAGA